MLDLFNQQLTQAAPLTDEQIAVAVNALIDESVSAELKADFLCALARKTETPAEIAAFARELRAKSIIPPLDSETRSRVILDVCGTGGDRLNTFNISTTVALICAADEVTVAKHGNRAVTSQAGSADVLEALGVKIELSPEAAARSLRDHHFAFFFAPLYNPIVRHVSAARKICAQRGQRTIFNFLGPLLNPARPTAQLVGVPQPALCAPLAQVLQTLGVQRAMVVSGRVGDAWLDELSTLGDNNIAEFYQEKGFAESIISTGNFAIQPAVLADLAGGASHFNAQIIEDILVNKDTGPRRDAVLLNAGAALFVAGKTKSIAAGWDLADKILATGRAKAKLDELVASK